MLLAFKYTCTTWLFLLSVHWRTDNAWRVVYDGEFCTRFMFSFHYNFLRCMFAQCFSKSFSHFQPQGHNCIHPSALVTFRHGRIKSDELNLLNFLLQELFRVLFCEVDMSRCSDTQSPKGKAWLEKITKEGKQMQKTTILQAVLFFFFLQWDYSCIIKVNLKSSRKSWKFSFSTF